MEETVKQDCLPKEDFRFPQNLVYKPGKEEAKQAWVAKLQNAMEASNNEELTNILQKISQAEEIPLKWSRYNRERFSIFLKHVLVDYQVNPKTDEQLWSLMIKDRPKKKNKCERKNGRKYVKNFSQYKKEVGKDTIENWRTAIKNILQTNISEELKNSLNKITRYCKFLLKKKHQAIDIDKFSNLLKSIPGYQVNSVIDEQLRVLISDELDIQEFKENDEQLLAKGLKAKSKHGDNWISFLTSLIDRENGKLVNDVEEKLALHENIVLKWETINKNDFKTFLSRKLGYEVNSEIANDLWNLGEKVRQEKKAKKQKETGDTDSTAKKSAVEMKNVAIPKTAEETKEEKQKRDVENAGDTEGVQKNIDLKTRQDDVQKKRTVKVKKVAIQKTAKKTKEKKRKREIEPSINDNSPKKIKESVELNTRENELCSSLNNVITVSQTEEPCCKVKWISIGKMLLLAADNKELPLQKFREKIIAEYLNRMGTAVSDKSSCSETLWSKCQSKLSKNPKFQIDSKRIRLVV
ncbi:hypothetical protein GHT06_013217 [Daphnia sinensis]|uniref:Cell growth-regulating nucleolar protein-like winged helix domain-containing protein n=1 Tax=Daphnia sinensis TaxID=1820382 RepID=A0AAD5KZQ0_9CRUS|nr:hypothetical protein GHT06_013217 [Daphnia sinensis]